MIKLVIDKLEEVAEAIRGEYKAGSDGKFYADVGDRIPDNHPAVGALVRAKQHVADERDTAIEAAKAAKAEVEKLKGDMHERLKGKVPQGDLEALEKSYQAKIADAEKAGGVVADGLRASLRSVLVEKEAQRIAGKIAVDSDAAETLSELIQKRLTVEIGTDNRASTRVLDSAGKPSAATLEDYEKEIVATKKYAGLLSASKASGGSAPGSTGAGSATPGKVDWLRGSPADLAAAAAKVNPTLGG
jgi:hypothetical protein